MDRVIVNFKDAQDQRETEPTVGMDAQAPMVTEPTGDLVPEQVREPVGPGDRYLPEMPRIRNHRGPRS